MADLVQLLESFINGRKEPLTFEDALSEVTASLDSLVEQGRLSLGEDYQLTGKAFEIRVRQLIGALGLNAALGRQSLEDFTVAPPSGATTQFPLVIEVKSSRKSQVTRDDLRQLDDWVFDLSQEEAARKQRLGGGIDSLAILSHGMLTSFHRHPSPHKGVLVVNAPVGTPFEQRTGLCLGANDFEFIDKRNFCIIPLCTLLQYCDAISAGKNNVLSFWEEVHRTCGVLQSPHKGDS